MHMNSFAGGTLCLEIRKNFRLVENVVFKVDIL